jgi:hypothetical protein
MKELTTESKITRLRIVGKPIQALQILDQFIEGEAPDEALAALQSLRKEVKAEADAARPYNWFGWWPRRAKEMR